MLIRGVALRLSPFNWRGLGARRGGGIQSVFFARTLTMKNILKPCCMLFLNALLVAATSLNALAQTVTATVTAGNTPWSVAEDAERNKIYVTNNYSNSVTVIDELTNTTASVAAGVYPQGIAVDAKTHKIYVDNYGNSTMTVIDGVTNTTTTLQLPSNPLAVAVNPETNKIYVVTIGRLTVIDGSNNTSAAVNAGSAPQAVAVNPVTNKIYVANQGTKNVTVIDGLTNTTTTAVVSGAPGSGSVIPNSPPFAIAVNSKTNKIYVANQLSNNVTVIDGTTNTPTTVGAGTAPVAIAVNANTNKIYVANEGSDNVTVIDGLTNTPTTVSAGSMPFALAVNPDTNKIYVANPGKCCPYKSTSVTVIDGATNTTTTVAAGSGPYAVAVNPSTNKIYVANQGSGNVTVIAGAGTPPPPPGRSDDFFVIGHMTNSPSLVDWAIGQGANALEMDLRFDANGVPQNFNHGGFCDCSCLRAPYPSGMVCSVTSNVCGVTTEVTTHLKHIASSGAALVILDSKIDDLSSGALQKAGSKVIGLIEDNLFTKGYAGKVIVGAPTIQTGSVYLPAAAAAAANSAYKGQIYFGIDGERSNFIGTMRDLAGLSSNKRVWAVGISACAPGQYYDQLDAGAKQQKNGVIGMVYTWTFDSDSSMTETLKHGVRGIITNYPARLLQKATDAGKTLATVTSVIPDATSNLIAGGGDTVCCGTTYRIQMEAGDVNVYLYENDDHRQVITVESPTQASPFAMNSNDADATYIIRNTRTGRTLHVSADKKLTSEDGDGDQNFVLIRQEGGVYPTFRIRTFQLGWFLKRASDGSIVAGDEATDGSGNFIFRQPR
jgi:YVTN family beta-propeller protein